MAAYQVDGKSLVSVKDDDVILDLASHGRTTMDRGTSPLSSPAQKVDIIAKTKEETVI